MGSMDHEPRSVAVSSVASAPATDRAETYEDLSYLLDEECKTTGAERRELVEKTTRINAEAWLYSDRYGSYRYVLRVDNAIVCALQFMSKDEQNATLTNAYTHMSHRRRGYARYLLEVAMKKFRQPGTTLASINFSKDRSLVGEAWVTKMSDTFWPCRVRR